MTQQRWLLLIGFLGVNGLIWLMTIRTATAPSAEALRLAAAATPTLAPSSVAADLIAPSETISLNGPWHYQQSGSEIAPFLAADLDPSQWPTMTIPQNWYLAGLNYHGVIWFARTFQADESWQGRAVNLHFAGVDYQADVWLNGQHLTQHIGYFQPFTMPIHAYLNHADENHLLVRVESPYEAGDWPTQKTLIKGLFGHHQTRPGSLAEAEGQSYNTGGIWGDVTLTVDNAVTITQMQLQAQWPDQAVFPNQAVFTLRTDVIHHADEPLETRSHLILEPDNFAGESISLPSQSGRLVRGTNSISLTGLVEQPQLWWTWDRGEPRLYKAKLMITANGTQVAERETTFGFRQFTVGEDGRWYVNQEPFFPRGTHYASSQWLAETDRAWFERDFDLLRAANLNAIRPTAHVEPPEFYQLADERGFLVWQDFPLYRGYADTPHFSDEAYRQLSEMIWQLYSHPSIGVWQVHQQAPWVYPEFNPGSPPSQNRRLDARLADLATQLDPTRYIYRESPSQTGAVYPRWEAGSLFELSPARMPALVTEYGVQALPNLAMLNQFIPSDSGPYSESDFRPRWRFHGFDPDAYAQVDEGENLTTFIEQSQAWQARYLQQTTEAFRRAKYQPVNGLFQVMFSDHWPAISPAVLDYARNPKPGYPALQTAMQPILPSIVPNQADIFHNGDWVYTDTSHISFELWIVNDTLQDYPKASLRWAITAADATPIVAGQRQGVVAADKSQPWYTLRDLALQSGAYRLSVTLTDKAGQVLGVNQMGFRVVSVK